jgi:hypothetical protein
VAAAILAAVAALLLGRVAIEAAAASADVAGAIDELGRAPTEPTASTARLEAALKEPPIETRAA